ncbi:MAG: phosphoserine phosphatase SerB [Caulobacterales bacterium]
MTRFVLTLVGRSAGLIEDAAQLVAAQARAPDSREMVETGAALDLHYNNPANPQALLTNIRILLAPVAIDWAFQPSSGRRKALLLADMDSTIIGQECIDELADYAGVKHKVAEITERAMRGELDFEAALIERVRMLEGLPLSKLEACFKERVKLNPGARILVDTMREAGAYTALVSGGFNFFTSRVAEAAGFDDNRANRLIDDGSHLTGDVARPILGRAAKRAALDDLTKKLNVPATAAIVMGDGANDLDMVRAAGLGVAYKAKPALAAEANARISAGGDLTSALYFQGYRKSEFVMV